MKFEIIGTYTFVDKYGKRELSFKDGDKISLRKYAKPTKHIRLYKIVKKLVTKITLFLDSKFFYE